MEGYNLKNLCEELKERTVKKRSLLDKKVNGKEWATCLKNEYLKYYNIWDDIFEIYEVIIPIFHILHEMSETEGLSMMQFIDYYLKETYCRQLKAEYWGSHAYNNTVKMLLKSFKTCDDEEK